MAELDAHEASKGDSILSAEREFVLQTYARAPVAMHRGEGVYLFDGDGKRYVDYVAGVAVNALGYRHPALLRALAEQAQLIVHSGPFFATEPLVNLAQRLVDHSFADRAFFSNSGTEAVEAALKFARRWARTMGYSAKTDFLAFSGSFHGRTMGSLAITDRPNYRSPFEPLVPGAHFARFNDLQDAEAKITQNVCAVIVEVIQGEAGIWEADREFLKGLRRLCDRNPSLLIVDEVQCGLGRSGDLWAHTASGIQPDIMTLAKPLAFGLPLGATLVTQAVADTIQLWEHSSTFGGNALACHAGCALFDIVNDGEFLRQVTENGKYLVESLKDLKDPRIVDVRGRGLMVGVELTIDAAPVIAAGYGEGVVLASAGARVLRLVPPLVIEREHIDLLSALLPKLFDLAGPAH
jgi:acetylornithine/N-succinyldiaminopimelate aminotransferase